MGRAERACSRKIYVRESEPVKSAARKATVFRTADSVAEMRRGGADLRDEPVVVDGRFITANGPAAARRFGGEIVAALTKQGR